MSTLEGRSTAETVPIGEAARIIMISRDGVDLAIRKGRLRVSRDSTGRRVVDLADVLALKKRLWAGF